MHLAVERLESQLRQVPRGRRALPDGFVIGFGNQPAFCSEFARRHAHEEAYFSILVHGDCVETVGANRERRLPRWIPSFHPPGEDHARSTGFTGYGVFGIGLPEDVFDRGERRAASVSAVDLTRSRTAARFASEYLQNDPASDFALSGLIYEMLAEALRSPGSSETHCPKWLLQARDLIHDGNCSLTAIADEVAVSPTHLAREFRSQFGLSVGDYGRATRLESALSRLMNTDHPISRIAAELGFADESHLVRLFKQRYGVTPGRYRRDR